MDDRTIHSSDDHAYLREGEVYDIRGKLDWIPLTRNMRAPYSMRMLVVHHADWTETYVYASDDVPIPFPAYTHVVVKARLEERRNGPIRDLHLHAIAIRDYSGTHVLL